MAKNKIENQHDEDLEDDKEIDDVIDSEDEEDDEADDEASTKEEGLESESSEEDDEESANRTKEADPEREAIRERRRREKKMKREREKRERMQLQNTIIAMADEIKKLKDGHGEVAKRFDGLTAAQIDSEIGELGKIYNQAQAAMEAAIADGDGKRFTQAKAISDKAWARYTLLETQKRQKPAMRQEEAFNHRESSSTRADAQETDDSSESVQLGREAKRLGTAFINKNKSWYDPMGGNRDSKIVLTIDADLYKEGYDPESKEYWEELEDRCKEYLPHRFKNQTVSKKPKSIVGGVGNDSSPAGSVEKSLPKEFVQTLKAAGYWEDPAKRKAAIKNYYSNKKGA